MVKGNHELPYNRKFKKWWQRHVNVRFDAPIRKGARRLQRQRTIAENFPRPIGKLRPIVHRPSFRFNMQTKFGKGFTLEELKAAGIKKKFAPTVGISVDYRRKNRCEESLSLNVERLKEYKSKLVIFPKASKAKRNGHAGLPDDTPRTAFPNPQVVNLAAAMPLNKGSKVMQIRAPTEAEKKCKVAKTLRQARREKQIHGKKVEEDPLAL